MILRSYAYSKGDLRMHSNHEDDGTFIDATLMTNPAKGFRRLLLKISDVCEYQSWMTLTGWNLTFEKRL